MLLLLCAIPVVHGQIVSNPMHLMPTLGATVNMGALNEGGSTELNIRLTSEPDSSVSVALTIFTGSAPTESSVAELDDTTLVFTQDNWDDYQTVTLTLKETDTHYSDSSHSILVNPQTLSGGPYNTAGLYLFSITNNDTPDLVLSSNSVTLHEGGSGSFTVALAVPPTGAVTVRLWQVGLVNSDITLDTDADAAGNQNRLGFTADNWSTAQTVTVNALQDDDALIDTAGIRLSALGGGYFNIIASLSVSVIDAHTQALTISPTSLTIEEGGSGNFTVALATRPSAAVTVSLNRTGQAEAVLGAFSLNFTTSNWSTAQTVTVNAAEDDDSQTDLAGISLTASGGDYGGVTGSLSVSVTDNDTPALALSTLSLSLNEGGSGIFTVALTTRPSDAVTVALVQSGTSNPDVSFSPASLSFTASSWSTPQNVSVTAAGDDDALSDSAGIRLTASGADYGSVTGSLTVSVIDSDTQALALSVPSLSLSEGGSESFTVALATRPSGAVSVALTGSGSGDVSFSPASLSFTASNWDTAQSVTVSAAGDDDAIGDSASIDFSASGGDYADVTARLPVAVLDNDTQALTLSVSSLSLDEGGSGAFTVALATRPSAAVSVGLSGSGSIEVSLSPATLNFTTSNWGTAQSVAVSVGEDDDSLRNDVVISLSASGGDYADTTGSLSLAVTDNDPPGLALSASQLSVAEGSDGSFTVRLRTRPSEDVTVTLSQAGAANPDVSFDTDTAEAGSQTTLSFTGENWNSPQSVSVSAAEDDDALADSAAISLSADGGEYAGVSSAVSVSVSENDTAALTLSAGSLSLDEGGSGSFTVVLDTRPSGPVTVSLAKVGYGDVALDQSVLIFTVTSWSAAQTVMVRASQDDDAADDTARISLTAAGGEYDGLTGSVSISVTDDDTAALTLSAGSLSLNEGGSGTFTVVLDTRPSAGVSVSLAQPGTGNPDISISPASLSFTTDSWNRVQTVVIGAAEDDDAQNDSGSISLTASGGDYAGATGSLSVNIDDNDRPGLTLSVFSLTLNEGGSRTFTAVLDTRPSGSVSVALTRTGATGVTLGSSMLTFTDSNWNTPQSITVSAAEDDNGISDSATISLTASGGGYSGVAGALSVSVLDNDTPRLVLSENSISLEEGGSASFTVRLSTRPSEDVTVNLALSGDDDVTLGADSLSITTVNWGTPQSVTLSAAEDDDALADSAKLSLTVSGGGYGSVSESVSVLVSDNDTAGLTLSKEALTVAEGDSETFTVRLSTRPSDEVTVSLARTGSTDVTLGSASLSFTTSNWSTAQSVTVSAGEDSNGLGETAQIDLTAAGGGYAGVSGRVSVQVTDDDSPALTLSASALTVAEGGSAAFTAVLDTRPSGAVTVNLAGIGSADVTLNQSALIFTISNWDTAQTVTVHAAEDHDAIADSASITLTAVGGGYGGISGSLLVRVTENDAAGLALSKSALTPSEGGSESFTVALAAQPGAAVTVSLTQSGASNPDIGIAPTSLLFTPSNWDTARSVTVSAAEDDDALDERATIALSAAGGGYGSAAGSVSVSVDDDDTVGLSLSSSLLSLDEGTSGTFTVALATQPSADVSVSLTRNGSAEVNLSRYTLGFTQSSWSTPQSVTVSVGEDEDGFADSADIPLTAAGGDYEGISAGVSVSVADNDPTALSLSANALSVTEGERASFTVALGTRPSEAVTVGLTLSGSDDITLSESSLSFTTSNWATLRTVSVIVAEDDDTLGDTAQISLSASGGDYAGISSVVEVTAVDNDAPGLALSTPVLNVVEGADATFTVALTSQPGGDVTVGLTLAGSDDVTLGSTSLTFTTADWNTVQSVTVSAAQDDDALADAATLSLAALGGGYDGVGGSLAVQVTEDDTAALTLSKSALALSEGAGGSFTAALATLPSDTVTVTLARTGDADVSLDSPSLVFTTANWSTAQTVMVSAAEDDDALADAAAISLSSSGGSYGGVSGRITVAVSDNDTPGLSLSAASLNLTEGGSAGFTVALATRPSDAVSVSLSQSGAANPDVSLSPASLSFSLSNWNVPQTVTVSAVEDADTQADSAALALAASGGGYGSASGSVAVSVSDNDAPGLEFDPVSQAISLDEGGSGSFAVRLTTQPDEAVLVTPAQTGTANPDVSFTTGAMGFTRSNWNVFQTVTVSAAEDDDALGDSAAIGLSAAGADYGDITGSVSVSVIDDDSAGLSLSSSSLELDEGGSGSFTVMLATRPSGDVTVSLGQPGAANPDVTLSASTLSFTAEDWSAAQSVTLSAAEDQDARTDSATIRLSASGGGYGGVTGSVSVLVLDDDLPQLIISADALALNEGGSQTFTVRLSTQPSVEVTVDLSRSGSSGVTFSPTSLSFTSASWNIPQTVTVSTAEDADALSEAAMISLTASGGGVGGAGGAGGAGGGVDSGGGYGGVTGSVSVSVTDRNTIGLVLSQSALTFDEGSGGSFTVRLKTAPSATVTLTLAQSGTANPDVSLSPSSMSFTASNWNAAQTAMVDAVRDADAVFDSATVRLSAAGGDYAGVSGDLLVTVDDLDEIALALSTGRLTVGEGAGADFTVALDSQPSDEVTVALSLSGSGDVSVSPASLIFTPSDWGRAQTVTVSAAPDEDALAESAAIALSASGGGYGSAAGSVEVSVTDDEATALALSQTSLRLDEGGSVRFTVHLASRPGGAVTVTLVQPGNTDVTLDTDSDAPGPQNTLSFTASDWSTPRHVLLLAAEDDDSLDETAEVALSAAGGDYAGVTAQVRVEVVDDDSVGIQALPNPVTVMEGGSAAIQIALRTLPSGPVTLTLTQIGSISGDLGLDADPQRSGSQATLSFTPSNWSDPQTVQISAGHDSDTLDDDAVIALSAAGGGYTGVIQTVEISVTDDDEPSIVLSSTELTVAEGDAIGFAVVLSGRPSAAVSVALVQPAGAEATLDGSGVLGGVQSVLSFTDQNWSQPQVVTVSAHHDPDAIDEILSLLLRAQGGASEYAGAEASVLLTVEDDETAGLAATPDTLEIAEGATSSFSVALTSQPTSDVVVAIAHPLNTDIRIDTDPAGAAGSQNLLNFTPHNWSAAQSVSVAALHDADSLDYSELLTMTASGADYAGLRAGVQVQVRDDDRQGLVLGVEEVSGAAGVDEGASLAVGVRLASRPTGPVSLAVSSGDAEKLTVSPAQLDFTQDDWAVAQSVTVTAPHDPDSVSERIEIALDASGADYAGVGRILAVRVADDEVAGLNLSASLLKVGEGGSARFTVALDNPPIAEVTVELAVSDETASSVSPVRLSFAPGSWSEPQEVSVSGLEDDDWENDEDAVLLSAAGGGYDAVTGRVAVVVQDDDEAALVLSVEALEVAEGGSASFAVRLSTRPQDAVRVTLADDSGALALIPGRLDFTRDSWARPQVVTVVGIDDADGQNEAAALRLSGGGADYEGVSAELAVTVLDDEQYNTTPEEIETAKGVLEEVGRALLSNSVDVIAQRFNALPGARALADVGGAEFEIGAEGALGRMLLGALRHFDAGAVQGAGGTPPGASNAPVLPDHLARLGSIGLRDGRPLRLGPDDTPDPAEPLLREFSYPFAGSGAGGETTVWARFERAEFSGRFRGLEQYYEGSQGGVSAGVDQRFDNGVLFGAAVSQSAGDARYAVALAGDRVSMDTELLLVMPYLEVPVRGGVLSLILGSGGGELRSLEAEGAPSRAHLSVQMFSLGTKWPLTRPGRRISLALTAHLGASRLGSSCSTGGLLCGLSASSGRLNAGVELTHGEVGGDWRMTPRYELSLRQDSGGQSKGVGMEFSGSIRMVAPGSRFSVDAGLRWLGLHATGEYEEWGAGVELRLRSRDAAGRGLTLGLGPRWGAPQSGGALQADGVFGSDPRDMERQRQEAGRAALSASAGYGLDLRSGMLTPFAEYSVAGGAEASGRLQGGLRYLRERSGKNLEARLFGERETRQDTRPRRRIGLELSGRF